MVRLRRAQSRCNGITAPGSTTKAERGGVRLAILMLACFAQEMDVFCSPRKDGKRGVFNGRVWGLLLVDAAPSEYASKAGLSGGSDSSSNSVPGERGCRSPGRLGALCGELAGERAADSRSGHERAAAGRLEAQLDARSVRAASRRGLATPALRCRLHVAVGCQEAAAGHWISLCLFPSDRAFAGRAAAGFLELCIAATASAPAAGSHTQDSAHRGQSAQFHLHPSAPSAITAAAQR
ncbi:hypothetical protein SVAN01_00810 [Stagonosporopsis vannaccii]|nr:hypothetical protein SVAN01_00810 [Stagonosporopsis vannaccii]